MNRRNATFSLLGLTGVTALQPQSFSPHKNSFIYSLNMSTLRGHNLGFRKELEIASKAGFQSVEIWINSLQDYLKQGNSLTETRRMIADLGLNVEGAIGFAAWIVDDQGQRSKSIEQLKMEMDQLADIGCKRIAAPPVGATQGEALDLNKITERYRTILEIGKDKSVIPHLELWGFSKNLSRVGELLYVAAESDHPDARLLMDVYHLHKGGSGMDSVKWVGKPMIEVFHINDYPAQPGRETITDADRVYAGDGVAPLKDLIRTLNNPDKPVVLSFEVFNKSYYAQDPLVVAKTGLAKMKAIVGKI